ncbi:hypothetical protein ABZV78_06430 [Micromonospora sp. NPDC004540]|uniref:hypothetical protein n=1 Tax=Micromonospora sp. NPDC004540 TaxID=3154457 RepID=UPI0033BB64A9
MTLNFCRELSAADWIAHSDLSWQRLVTFGPAGFDAYARLRFLPDPARPGQSENDAAAGWPTDQLPTLFEVLATHTTTPEHCYFCVWEGFGDADVAADDNAVYIDEENSGAPLERSGGQPGLAPTPAAQPSMPRAPKVVVPNRAYWLFRGPLADVGTWDTAAGWPGQRRLSNAEPAFAWPADHAWCVAKDVDPHWAGIGGTRALITQLTTDPRLDVVPADPTQDQPLYR